MDAMTLAMPALVGLIALALFFDFINGTHVANTIGTGIVSATPFAVDRRFRQLQFVSASLYSLGHGGNDAQKTLIPTARILCI
ncbi:hypothetical protein [Azospirillum sp. sgz301742]